MFSWFVQGCISMCIRFPFISSKIGLVLLNRNSAWVLGEADADFSVGLWRERYLISQSLIWSKEIIEAQVWEMCFCSSTPLSFLTSHPSWEPCPFLFPIYGPIDQYNTPQTLGRPISSLGHQSSLNAPPCLSFCTSGQVLVIIIIIKY